MNYKLRTFLSMAILQLIFLSAMAGKNDDDSQAIASTEPVLQKVNSSAKRTADEAQHAATGRNNSKRVQVKSPLEAYPSVAGVDTPSQPLSATLPVGPIADSQMSVTSTQAREAIEITRTLSLMDGNILQRVPQELKDTDIYGLDGVLYGYICELLSTWSALKLTPQQRPKCFICYAWPDERDACLKRQQQVRFIRELLHVAGIDACMDIMDNDSGTIDIYRHRVFEHDIVLFLGSKEVLEKSQLAKQKVVKNFDVASNIDKEIKVMRERMHPLGVEFIIPVVLDDKGHEAIKRALELDAVHDDWSSPFGQLKGLLETVHKIYQKFFRKHAQEPRFDIGAFEGVSETYKRKLDGFVNLVRPERLEGFKKKEAFVQYQRSYERLQALRALYGAYQDNATEGDLLRVCTTRNRMPIERFKLTLGDEGVEKLIHRLDEKHTYYELATLHQMIGVKIRQTLSAYQEEETPRDIRLLKGLEEFADKAFSNASDAYEKVRGEKAMACSVARSVCLFERGRLRHNGITIAMANNAAEQFYRKALEADPENIFAKYRLAQILHTRLGPYNPATLFQQVKDAIDQIRVTRNEEELAEMYKMSGMYLGEIVRMPPAKTEE